MNLGIMQKISLVLVALMIHLCWMTTYSWAQMVKTQNVIFQKIPYPSYRAMLVDALDGKMAQNQIDHYGISKAEALARINSLTDEEISGYWAQMVKTRKSTLPENSSPLKREMLLDALNRKQVQQQLEQNGISREEAANRITSLTDAEVAAIAAKVGPLPFGGDHDYEDDGDDDLWLFVLLVFLIIVFIGVILVVYVLGVLAKGSYCIFADCEDKGGLRFVFRPWWDDVFFDPPEPEAAE